jgi:hypothetical protein
MSNKQLKSIIRDAWGLEDALIDLLKECLDRIYGEKGNSAFSMIENNIESYSETLYLPSLNKMDEEFAEREERLKKYHEQQKNA